MHYGVAKLGEEYISLAGYPGEGIDSLYSEDFIAIFGIIPGVL